MEEATRHFHIPSELVLEVFSWLPLKYVMQCKLLSKFWYHQITRKPSLAQRRRLNGRNTHAGGPELLFCVRDSSKQKAEVLFLNPDEKGENFKIGHSFSVDNIFGVSQIVDGLVIFSRADRITMLYNLYTRDCFNLPDLNFKDSQTLSVNFLIGCDSSNTGFNYKVVHIREVHIEKRSEIRYEVYTCGGSIWRRVDHLPSELYRFPSSSVSVNGIIYHYLFDKVLAFDLSDEKFHIISVPNNIDFSRETAKLTRIDGCVALMDWRIGLDPGSMVIKLLKLTDCSSNIGPPEIYDVRYGVAGILRPEPVSTVCIDEIVIRDDWNNFFCYNRGRRSFSRINLPENCINICGVPYEENIMPLRNS